MLKRVEWLAVISFVLVVAAWLGILVDIVNLAEGTALMISALVLAVLSLRSR